MPSPFTSLIAAIEEKAKHLSKPTNIVLNNLGVYNRVSQSSITGVVSRVPKQTTKPATLKEIIDSYDLLKRKEVSSPFIHPTLARFSRGDAELTHRNALQATRDLGIYAEKFSPLPYPVLVSIFAQLVAGLSALHSKRIIHRDLKPANILVTNTPNGPHVQISDLDTAIEVLPENKEDKETQRHLFAADMKTLGESMAHVISFSPEQTEKPLRDLVTNLRDDDPEKRPTITQLQNHPLLVDELVKLDRRFPSTRGKFELKRSPEAGVVNLLLPPLVNEIYEDIVTLSNMYEIYAHEAKEPRNESSIAGQMWRTAISLHHAREAIKRFNKDDEGTREYETEINRIEETLKLQLNGLSAQISSRLINNKTNIVDIKNIQSFPELLCLYFYQMNQRRLTKPTIEQFFDNIYFGLKPAYREQALQVFVHLQRIHDLVDLAKSKIGEIMHRILHFNPTRNINDFSKDEMQIYIQYIVPKLYAGMHPQEKRAFHEKIKRHTAYNELETYFKGCVERAWREAGGKALDSLYFSPLSKSISPPIAPYRLPTWDGERPMMERALTSTAVITTTISEHKVEAIAPDPDRKSALTTSSAITAADTTGAAASLPLTIPPPIVEEKEEAKTPKPK